MKRLAAVLLAALAAASAADAKRGPAPTITVMTRNLYVGTDLSRIFLQPSVADLLNAVGEGYANVLASNYAERADAVAAEIARSRPDLVGLQEVILLRTQTPSDGQATPATDVQLDYLRFLLDSLAARGLSYTVAGSTLTGDDELPSALGFDVRVTNRDVLLARRDSGAPRPTNRRGRRYEAVFTLVTRLGPLSIERGWVSVDAVLRGRTVRVISTHLEAFAPSIQAAQGQELVRGPARTRLPVIMVGDFNSRADGTGTRTYGELRAAGFGDAWARTHPGDPGLTCCHAADLRSERTFHERIDLVLFKGRLRPLSVEIVGEEPQDRTPSGLWPSDHAGVVAKLRLSP